MCLKFSRQKLVPYLRATNTGLALSIHRIAFYHQLLKKLLDFNYKNLNNLLFDSSQSYRGRILYVQHVEIISRKWVVTTYKWFITSQNIDT